jgi:heptosyltransferase I
MKRILIIKLGAIGDVIHSLPVLSTLRVCYPDAMIGWAVEEAAAPVLKGNPDLNELILLERKKLKGRSGIAYLRQWLRAIRNRSFDVSLDLHNLFKTGIISQATRAPIRIGFRKLREGNFIFMNRWAKPDPRYHHAVQKYLSLLKPLGIQEAKWRIRFPLTWESSDGDAVDVFLSKHELWRDGTLVAVNPGANWPSKRWMPERYAIVADELIKTFGIRVLILWGPGERVLAENMLHQMSEKAFIAPQTTLKQLMALIKQCKLLISGDTGPAHLAAALGVPTVTLFGPSDPRRNGPYGEPHKIVASPLAPAGHFKRKERGDRWLRAIEVEPVIEAAKEQLERIDKVAYSSPEY